MKKILNIIGVAVLLAGFCACEKDDAPKGATTDQVLETLEGTSINGTKLEDGVDLAGVIKDDSGHGIAGIAVTDGYTFVKTDANGVYQMKRNELSRKVYYTVPAEYQIPLDSKYHLPNFFSPGIFTKGTAYRCDFELKKLSKPETNFTMVMIGDPQCQTIDEVARYMSETMADLRRTLTGDGDDAVYALTLGDITFDSYYTFDPMVTSMKNVIVNNRYLPIFQSAGNHDHDSRVTATGDVETDDYNAMLEYVKRFGPTDYSFDRGNCHIVVMDNVLVEALEKNSSPNKFTWNYTNELTDTQMEWLRQDIANVENPESKLILFCTHQPLRAKTAGNYGEVKELLSKFNEAHIMVGHTHYTQNYIGTTNGKEIYEHIHGAACGGWWNANINVTGSPNGYNVYKITGNQVKDWYLKPTDLDATYQLRVYDGSQEFGSTGKIVKWCESYNYGTYKATGDTRFKDSFVVEVFDDDAKYWTVELWQNGAKVGDFERAADSGINNMAVWAFWYNKGKNTSTWTSTTGSHYWFYKPASGKPSEETGWEVRATHTFPNGGSVTYTRNALTTDFSEFEF